jgi:7-cyano-7-deazaguanine synthase in queuosine biosynthesis
MSLSLHSLLDKYGVNPTLSGRYVWQKDKEAHGIEYPLPIRQEYLDLMKLVLGLHIIETDRLGNIATQLILETSFPDYFLPIIDQLQSLFLHLTDYRIELKVVPSRFKAKPKRLDEGSHYKKAVLFSSGLDSLCGAIEFSKQYATALTHCQTNQVVFHKTLELSKMQQLNRSPLFCFNAMTKSTAGGMSNTRGLLFLSFAYSVVASLGMESVMFCENGSQMLDVMASSLVYPNKPATKNTNPVYTEAIERVLSSFGDKSIRIERPYQEFTRSEIIAPLKNHIRFEQTFSCFTTRGKTAMCGICYNCFIRRMSLLALGIKENIRTYEKHPFELASVEEQSESYQSSLRISLHVLRHYAKILNEDLATLDEVKLYARDYFKNPIDLAMRSAKDVFLGVMRSLETVEDAKLNQLGKKAKELLNQIDKSLLIDRGEELMRLSLIQRT